MVRDYFETRIVSLGKTLSKLESRSSLLAVIRVAIFLIGIVGFLMLIDQRNWQSASLLLAISITLFLVVLKRHLVVRFEKRHNQLLIDINREEINRLDRNFEGLAGGEEYRDGEHQYSSDLDLFGENSLFQFLNRTTSSLGESLLVERLKKGLEKDLALKSQKAVQHLVTIPDWLQRFQALGRHEQIDKEELKDLLSWSQQEHVLLGSKGLRFLSIFLPVLLLLTGSGAWYFDMTYYITLPVVLVNVILLAKQHNYAKETVDNTYRSILVLGVYKRQMQAVAEQQFTDPLLKEYAARFLSTEASAEKSISQLKYYLSQLEVRNNMLHVFFNVAFLLDIHWLYKLENWRERHNENLLSWIHTLAEFEYLGSLASMSFSNSEWTFARFSERDYELKGLGLGHPLLTAEKNVTNDFNLEKSGDVVLLTGPNMAGKSTFLRTVAINVVLARMGAPSCAKTLVIDHGMQVFTAMRVADALSDNMSSFYAEIYRIGKLLELIKNGEHVLFFLDEILKGTNSADRHKGAEGLIKQLIQLKTSGFISTHDLELGSLTSELEEVKNFSFESIIEGDEISFDYKLREGICQSFNACALMRQMGIEV